MNYLIKIFYYFIKYFFVFFYYLCFYLFVVCYYLFAFPIKLILRLVTKTKKTSYDIFELDLMDGHKFEYACADILRSNGFVNVVVTQGSGDFGVDIIAEKNKIKYAIQCKRYNRKLNNKPIQEVIGGLAYYKCQKGIVMTNNYFTDAAKQLALVNKIELYDRKAIITMLKKASISESTHIQAGNNKDKHITEKENDLNSLKNLYIEKYNKNRKIQEIQKKQKSDFAFDILFERANKEKENIMLFYNEIKDYDIFITDFEINQDFDFITYFVELYGETTINKLKQFKNELINYLRAENLIIENNGNITYIKVNIDDRTKSFLSC